MSDDHVKGMKALDELASMLVAVIQVTENLQRQTQETTRQAQESSERLTVDGQEAVNALNSAAADLPRAVSNEVGAQLSGQVEVASNRMRTAWEEATAAAEKASQVYSKSSREFTLWIGGSFVAGAILGWILATLPC